MGRCYRFPHTKNEATQYYSAMAYVQELDITIQVRSKRHANVLPHAYDDLMREFVRTWKHTRKTQWRVRE